MVAIYSSLKEWINIPLIIKPLLGYSGTGVKSFDEPIETLCYPVGESTAVRSVTGVEITSNTQLYVTGDTPITSEDTVTLNGVDYLVHAIKDYYRDGKIDIRVVYL